MNELALMDGPLRIHPQPLLWGMTVSPSKKGSAVAPEVMQDVGVVVVGVFGPEYVSECLFHPAPHVSRPASLTNQVDRP